MNRCGIARKGRLLKFSYPLGSGLPQSWLVSLFSKVPKDLGSGIISTQCLVTSPSQNDLREKNMQVHNIRLRDSVLLSLFAQCPKGLGPGFGCYGGGGASGVEGHQGKF